MKWASILIGVLGLLIGAVAIAPLFRNDPGYVLIRFMDYSAETSVLVLLVGLLLFYAIIRLAVWLWTMPTRTLAKARTVRAQKQLEKGLLALTEGDWRGAEKALAKSSSKAGQETVGYLAAARAAQGQDDEDLRDEYLEMANSGGAHKRFLVELSRSKLLVTNGDVGAALPILEGLQKRRKKHPQVLELLARCYRELGDWERLKNLLPQLRKAGIVDNKEVDKLTRLSWMQQLRSSNSAKELKANWAHLPGKAKSDPDLVGNYAELAADYGAAATTEPLLRKTLNKTWRQDLVSLYGEFSANDEKRRIAQCEKWLNEHGQDAHLNLALGQLCLNEKLWGKAKDYLEASLRQKPTSKAYETLGSLLERQGEVEAAMVCFRNALRVRESKAPDPLPVSAHRLGSPSAAATITLTEPPKELPSS